MNSVYRQQDFETYVLWKSLPSVLRGKPTQILEQMGIDDPLAVDLLAIRTQKEFCEKFSIRDPNTLTDWNKRIDKEGLVQKANIWARKLTPNVLLGLYKNITKNGRGQDVRTWYELVEGI